MGSSRIVKWLRSISLTIAEVARRSRLTTVTISRLENLHNRNPSLDTLNRYAMAIDALVTLGFEEIEPDEEMAPA
jgi:transcriptional regulator with XRE-family HTH domain